MGIFDGVVEKATPMFNELKAELARLRAEMDEGQATDQAVLTSIKALDQSIDALRASIVASNRLAAAEAKRDIAAARKPAR